MPASRRGFGSMLAALIVVALANGCAFGGTRLSEVARRAPLEVLWHRLPPLTRQAQGEVTSSSSAAS